MNTAGRLLDIYDKLVSNSRTNEPMIKVWTEIFNIPTDTRHLEDDVVMCLYAVRSEMELLRTKLAAMGAPEDLMNPGMARFRNVASTAYINQSWGALHSDISRPENRLSFSWADWVLREENEEVLPDEELAALRGELDILEKSFLEVDMAPYLRDFVQRQVDAIRAALRVYRVQGVKPIEKALQQVAGAYTIEKSNIEAEHAKASESARSVFANMGAFIEKTAKVADQLDKIRKVSEGAYTLAARVAPVLLTYGQSLIE